MSVVKPSHSVKVAPSPAWSNRLGNVTAGGRASRTLGENVQQPTGGLNMENRDPKKINSHVTVRKRCASFIKSLHFVAIQNELGES